MTQKGKRAAVGAGFLGGAGIVGLLLLGSLTACIIAALAEGMDVWLAALIVTVVYAAVAGVLALLREPPGGTFTFLRGPPAQVPRAFPPRNTQQVLLDSLRKLDETGRLAG